MDETPIFQQETQLIQELPLRLSESVENFKNSFEEVLSAMQVECVRCIGFFHPLFAFDHFKKL